MQFNLFGYTIHITKTPVRRTALEKAGGVDLSKSKSAEASQPDWAGRIFDPGQICVSGAVSLELDQTNPAPLTVLSGNPDDLVVSFFESRNEKNLSLKIREHGYGVEVSLGAPFCEHIEVAGAATVTSKAVDQDGLCVNATGGATIHLEGAVNTLEVNAAGSANVLASRLKADDINVCGAGAADIEVCAVRSIKAKLSGSSDLHLWGKPNQISYATSGSATFTQKR